MTNPPKTPAEWATYLWQRMVNNRHKLTWSGFAATDAFTECAAQARREAFEDAAKACDSYKVEGRSLETNEFRHIDEALNNLAKSLRALAEKEK